MTDTTTMATVTTTTTVSGTTITLTFETSTSTCYSINRRGDAYCNSVTSPNDCCSTDEICNDYYKLGGLREGQCDLACGICTVTTYTTSTTATSTSSTFATTTLATTTFTSSTSQTESSTVTSTTTCYKTDLLGEELCANVTETNPCCTKEYLCSWLEVCDLTCNKCTILSTKTSTVFTSTETTTVTATPCISKDQSTVLCHVCNVSASQAEDTDDRAGHIAVVVRFGPNGLHGDVSEDWIASYNIYLADACNQAWTGAPLASVSAMGVNRPCCDPDFYGVTVKTTVPSGSSVVLMIVPVTASGDIMPRGMTTNAIVDFVAGVASLSLPLPIGGGGVIAPPVPTPTPTLPAASTITGSISLLFSQRRLAAASHPSSARRLATTVEVMAFAQAGLRRVTRQEALQVTKAMLAQTNTWVVDHEVAVGDLSKEAAQSFAVNLTDRIQELENPSSDAFQEFQASGQEVQPALTVQSIQVTGVPVLVEPTTTMAAAQASGENDDAQKNKMIAVAALQLSLAFLICVMLPLCALGMAYVRMRRKRAAAAIVMPEVQEAADGQLRATANDKRQSAANQPRALRELSLPHAVPPASLPTPGPGPPSPAAAVSLLPNLSTGVLNRQ